MPTPRARRGSRRAAAATCSRRRPFIMRCAVAETQQVRDRLVRAACSSTEHHRRESARCRRASTGRPGRAGLELRGEVRREPAGRLGQQDAVDPLGQEQPQLLRLLLRGRRRCWRAAARSRAACAASSTPRTTAGQNGLAMLGTIMPSVRVRCPPGCAPQVGLVVEALDRRLDPRLERRADVGAVVDDGRHRRRPRRARAWRRRRCSSWPAVPGAQSSRKGSARKAVRRRRTSPPDAVPAWLTLVARAGVNCPASCAINGPAPHAWRRRAPAGHPAKPDEALRHRNDRAHDARPRAAALS